MVALGWTVLALVFLDELLAWWPRESGVRPRAGWCSLSRCRSLVVLVWFLFASPKARFGGPVVRPVVKVLVFGLASLGLWDAGHPGWALALLVFSVVVNTLALLPAVQALVDGNRIVPCIDAPCDLAGSVAACIGLSGRPGHPSAMSAAV